MLFYLSLLPWLFVRGSSLSKVNYRGDCAVLYCVWLYFIYFRMTSWSLSLKLFTPRHHNRSQVKNGRMYKVQLLAHSSLFSLFLEKGSNKMQWQVRMSHKTCRRNVASCSINCWYSSHQQPVMMFYWWIKMVSEAIDCLASSHTASYKDVFLNKFHN